MATKADAEPARPPRRLVLGSRGSSLALAQAEWVRESLKAAAPDLEIEIRVIKTAGDRSPDRVLTSGTEVGLFVKEIEQELSEGRIDLAVHSLKDLPLEQPQGLVIAAIPAREDAHDVLILRSGRSLADLPPGSRVGTGSPRRITQLLARRSDLVIQPIRGNVDTRLRKLEQGEVDALVLAAAGLRRIGATPKGFEVLSFDVMLPAPGQGALAVEIREEDQALGRRVRASLHHLPTAAAVEAERSFLLALGGGCQMPVGALGTVTGEVLSLEGVVTSRDGRSLVRRRHSGSVSEPIAVGEALGREVLAAGGEPSTSFSPSPRS